MSKQVALNQINVSDEITILDDTTGVPATGVVAATTGHEIWYQRDENTTVVTDGGSAADMSAITDGHTDWEFKHAKLGTYRVDLPDAAFLQGASIVRWGMAATGFSGVVQTIIINPFFKYQGFASTVTSTTTTFPANTDPYAGDEILVMDGTGIKQTRLIISVSGQTATHLAWDVNISDSTSSILLIAGDSHQVNLDAAMTTRSTLVGGDLTTETGILTALLPSALVNGKMDSNIARINDVAVIGAGTAMDKWRA